MSAYLSELTKEILSWISVPGNYKALLETYGIQILGQVLAGLLLLLIFQLATRSRKERAARQSGWFYLSPGLAARFVLLSASLLSLGPLLGGILAFRHGYYKPSFDSDGIRSIGLFAFFILGFGAIAIASYIAYFRNRVRWSHTHIEKIAGRHTTRIAWKDVKEVRQHKGADHLWIISDKARIKVWTHMAGVPQLIAAIDGVEEALGLLRQIRPTTEAKARPNHAGSFLPR
jgi:hypothetical protein